MTAFEQCLHDNGEKTLEGAATYQISGVCQKCGENLDILRVENWLRELQKRIEAIEGFLNI